MQKPVLVLMGVVLVLFVGITLLKSSPEKVSSPDRVDTSMVAEKETVRRFWDVYRQATDHRMAGHWAEAAEAYRNALNLNGEHEDALYYLGNMLLELEHVDDARRAWEHLARVNPNSARAHTQLGILFSCLEHESLVDLTAAEAAFSRALEINQEETGPLLHLGQIALVRGNLAEAEHFFDAVTGSNYKSVEAHFLSGYVAWNRRDMAQASIHFQQALRHAQPETPPQGVLGEGDTKAGSTPMMAKSSPCHLFQPFIADLTSASSTAPRFDVWYPRLDTFLQHIRLKIV